jgi:hypothetical protein
MKSPSNVSRAWCPPECPVRRTETENSTMCPLDSPADCSPDSPLVLTAHHTQMQARQGLILVASMRKRL